jgi:hypothetical protein
LLQALLVLFKKVPPQGHKLLVRVCFVRWWLRLAWFTLVWRQIVATTSCQDVLRQMGMLQGFTKTSHLPLVDSADQLLTLLDKAFSDAELATISAAVSNHTLKHVRLAEVALCLVLLFISPTTRCLCRAWARLSCAWA